jgi:hypothetical protein
VCRKLFDRGISDDTDIGVSFGNDQPADRNVFFVSGSEDPWLSASVTKSESWFDRRVSVVNGTGHCADLVGSREDDKQALKETRANVFAAVKDWISLAIGPPPACGEHGKNIMGRCKCCDGWTGDYCETLTHRGSSFKGLAVAAILVSMILLIGGVVSARLFDNPKALNYVTVKISSHEGRR